MRDGAAVSALDHAAVATHKKIDAQPLLAVLAMHLPDKAGLALHFERCNHAPYTVPFNNGNTVCMDFIVLAGMYSNYPQGKLLSSWQYALPSLKSSF